jgi:phosphomevalonate kinase
MDHFLLFYFWISMEVDKEYHIRVPGKCLLSGGYLILEKGEKGLSVSVSAETCARVIKQFQRNKVCTIHIQSPDLNEEWEYTILNNGSISSNVYCIDFIC